MAWLKLLVFLILVCALRVSLGMNHHELEDFANFLKKTSQLSPTLKKGAEPEADYDEDEPVSDHAWEESGKFEGDLVLNERQRRLIVEDVAEGLSRNGITDGTKRWPNNEVIYFIQREHFNSDQVQAIQNGIEDLAQASCVKFRPYRKGDRDAVVIQGSRRGCFSQVGYQGGYQVLNLSGRHPVGRGCFRHGTVVHEMLHTLGFYHMQSSPDRDDYVNVVWENIIEQARHNFRKYNSFAVSDFGVGYDYDSVLHYSRRAFSINGKDTIVPKKRGATIGQRLGLSAKDTEKLNRMYCDAGFNEQPIQPADEVTTVKSEAKKKIKTKNKPFNGEGIGYHQGKAVVIKLLPAAETYKLADVPSFHVFDYFSKAPQIQPMSELQGFRIGTEIGHPYTLPGLSTTGVSTQPITYTNTESKPREKESMSQVISYDDRFHRNDDMKDLNNNLHHSHDEIRHLNNDRHHSHDELKHLNNDRHHDHDEVKHLNNDRHYDHDDIKDYERYQNGPDSKDIDNDRYHNNDKVKHSNNGRHHNPVEIRNFDDEKHHNNDDIKEYDRYQNNHRSRHLNNDRYRNDDKIWDSNNKKYHTNDEIEDINVFKASNVNKEHASGTDKPLDLSEDLNHDLDDAFHRLSKMIRLDAYRSRTPNLDNYKINEDYSRLSKPLEIEQSQHQAPTPRDGDQNVHKENVETAVEYIQNVYISNPDKPTHINIRNGIKNEEQVRNADRTPVYGKDTDPYYRSYPIYKQFVKEHFSKTDFDSPVNSESKDFYKNAHKPVAAYVANSNDEYDFKKPKYQDLWYRDHIHDYIPTVHEYDSNSDKLPYIQSNGSIRSDWEEPRDRKHKDDYSYSPRISPDYLSFSGPMHIIDNLYRSGNHNDKKR